MTPVELLTARLTEVEKMKIRMSNNEDSIVSRYHDYKTELSGGIRLGGTEEEGIAQMKQVRDMVNEAYAIGSNTDVFGRSWAF